MAEAPRKTPAPQPDAGPVLVRVSPALWRFMVFYFGRFLRRHMNALRLPLWSAPPAGEHRGPIVVYTNHPAWWDAAIVILLAGRLYPDRESHAPFDARMLARYPIFRRLGGFPVELDTPRGGAQFLAASRAILAGPRRMLWITAQGRFVDVRVRPLGLRPGIARLPEIAPDALFVPMALEYAFWDERGAEAFAAFGTPIAGADLAALPRSERLAHLEEALTGTLDRLSADITSRDASRFSELVSGAKGVGGVYDVWRLLKAALSGRRFDPAHRAGLPGGEGPNP